MSGAVLIAIANLRQWSVLQAGHALPGGAVVVTPDFDVSDLCVRAGLPVINPHDLIDDAEASESTKFGRAVCGEVGKRLRGHLMWLRGDIGERTCNDLWFALGGWRLHGLMMRRAFQRLKPEALWCFGETQSVVFWDPPNPPPDGFNAVSAATAQDLNVPVKLLTETEPQHYGAFAPVALPRRPGRVIPLARQVDWIAWCPGLDAREMELLLTRARDRQRRDVLVVSDVSIIDGLPFLSMTDILRLPFDFSGFKSSVAAWRYRSPLSAAIQVVLGNAPEYAMEPYLQTIWEAYCDRLMGNARQYAAGWFLSRSLSPKTLIVGYDVSGATRCLSQAFEHAGVPVIAVEHAAVGGAGSHMRHSGARAHVAALGVRSADMQRMYRSPDVQIRPVGSLMRDMSMIESSLDESGRVPSLKTPKPTIVLLSTRVVGLQGAAVRPSLLMRSWLDLFRLAARRSDWSFIVKPHPRYDHPELYARLAADCGAPIRVINPGDPFDVWAEADVTVLVNCRSTVALHAVVHGVPMVYFHDAVRRNDFSRSSLAEELLIITDNIEKLEVQIDRLCRDPMARQMAVAHAREGLSAYVTATNAMAVDQAEAFIRDIQATTVLFEAPERRLFDALFCAAGMTKTSRSDVAALLGNSDELAMFGIPANIDLKRLVWKHSFQNVNRERWMKRVGPMVRSLTRLPATLRPGWRHCAAWLRHAVVPGSPVSGDPHA